MIRIKESPPVTIDRSITSRGCINPDQATCLYRHYSGSEELLYLGVSVSPIARNEEHRSGAQWFTQIARIELQWFASYTEAIEAERRAIREEKPRYNKIRYEGPTQQAATPSTKGRPRIYVTAAERQRAYRARKKAAGGSAS